MMGVGTIPSRRQPSENLSFNVGNMFVVGYRVIELSKSVKGVNATDLLLRRVPCVHDVRSRLANDSVTGSL